MKEIWHVHLGRLEWLRFTYPRCESDPMQLIGSIRRGPQIGALAILGDQFFQVNGDFTCRLSPFLVRKAVAKARAAEAPARPSRGMGLKRTTPEIKFKRRRVFTMTD